MIVKDEIKVVSSEHRVHVTDLGVEINFGRYDDDPEDASYPYVTISTQGMKPEDIYDYGTGLRGDADPFSVVDDDGTEDYLVTGPFGVCARFIYNERFPTAHKREAGWHADNLNNTWAEACGTPRIAVHLNDAVLYDDEGSGDTVKITEVYVVRPHDPAEDVAVFTNEEDAEAFAATFEDVEVETAQISDRVTARRMIEDRVTYTVDGDTLRGFFVCEDGEEMMGEIFALREDAQNRADELNAEESA